MLYLWKRNTKNTKYINHQKARDHCPYTGKYRGEAHKICNLKFKVPNEIPVFFHDGANYDYHFIIKKLASEFERQFECLGENREKYKTLSAPVKKKITKIDIDDNESIETISYKIKFSNSMKFIGTSLSKLVDNLTEEIQKVKYKDCGRFFKYESVKDNLINVYLAIKNIERGLMKNQKRN